MSNWEGGSTRRWRRIRAEVLARDGYRCQVRLDICTDKATCVHHTRGRGVTGDDPRYLVASCAPCNGSVGDPTRTEHEKFTALDPRTPLSVSFSLSPGGLVDGAEVRQELVWSPAVLSRYEWLEPFLEVPEDANPPLAMSPPPDDAVGSYGADAVAWIERTQQITLRWWQRLAITRQLEHRENGSLCHGLMLESGPRRIGKSWRLRGTALWRMEHGSALFGERQEIVHTGSDMAVCRKAQKEAWRWSEAAGWTVTRGNGKEAIERPGGDVWLVRAQTAVYGWDTTLGLVDEAWDVKPDTVSEGLEPSLMGRQSPQLHMTSTAHRKATSTMRSALSVALSTPNPKTLILLWAAPAGADPGDPDVWRAASPYWDEERRDFIAGKYEKALAGEEDPEFDDPDPMRGFCCQYLNQWPLKEPRTVGDPVTSEEAWGELVDQVPARTPDAVVVEDWFTEGVSVAEAWRLDDGGAAVRVTAHADLALAAQAVAGIGLERPVVVGASIADDPVWKAHKLRTEPQTGTVRSAVGDLMRMLSEDLVAHDGGDHLTGQVLALRTSPGVDGPRIRSTSPADAVKAAVWAVHRARTLPAPKSRLVVL